MIFGTPTGAYRFRQSVTGKMVLQIACRWHGMAAYSRVVGEQVDWRDAVEADLRHPALRALLPTAVEPQSESRDPSNSPPITKG